MKRIGIILLSLAMLLTLLCACGGSGGSAAASPPVAEDAMASQTPRYGANDSLSPEEPAAAPETVPTSDLKNAKLIYTASLEMETTDFAQADKDLTALVDQMGGYFQDSSVNNYGSGYRSGSYTVRVPVAKFKPFCDQMGRLCHVTNKTSSAENVSEAYYDTESRLTTQKTKLQRLQALLAKAEKMEDIITLESAISETELTIEQLSGTLRQYDALVDFATVYLTMTEVYKLSNTEEPATGFAQRMGTALASGWKNFVSGLEGLLVGLAYGWPWVLVLAVVVLVVVRVLVVRKRRRQPHVPEIPPLQAPEQEQK